MHQPPYIRFDRLGGLAALICAATYLTGFALLLTLLAPLGYGSSDINAQAVVAFIAQQPFVMIIWNLTIYVLNALALTVLVLALCQRFRDQCPRWAIVSLTFGLIWATLVFGAGMIANMAVEQAASLYAETPELAAQTWQVLHTVELGLGGGNEIVGAVWIFAISVCGVQARAFPVALHILGLIVSTAGFATVLPSTGDAAGAFFGLGMIVWFIWIGFGMVIGANKTAILL
jgi:hypothetical protein